MTVQTSLTKLLMQRPADDVSPNYHQTRLPGTLDRHRGQVKLVLAVEQQRQLVRQPAGSLPARQNLRVSKRF